MMLWGKERSVAGGQQTKGTYMPIPWPSLYPLWSGAPSTLHPNIPLSGRSLRLSASPLAGS